MRADQIIVFAYFLLGTGLGIVSNYFNEAFGSIVLAIVVPFVVYTASSFPLFQLAKHKKKNWLVKNSLITFILVWFIVWIIAHNI